MHIDYRAQLELKKKFVNNAISRIGKFKNFEIEEIIGMKTPLRYRNKMVFPFAADKENNIHFGFFRERSHDLVPLSDCMLGSEVNFKILDCVKKHMEKHKIAAYNERNHRGAIRRVFTRISHHTGEIMVVISSASNSLPESDELVCSLRKISDNISSIILNINKEQNNLVLGKHNVLLFGKFEIIDYICDLKYEISPQSFFQVNPVQTEILYKKAIEFASISSEDIVLDLYCGIGTISLYAAKFAKSVIGVEIVPQAIENAKKNAIQNNISNAHFYTGEAQDLVPKLISEGLSPDVIILDPPRKGSDEMTLSAIVSAQPKRIVYVSCSPTTLARDMHFLSEYGYYPMRAAAVDMFPHTSHVETIALLQNRNM